MENERAKAQLKHYTEVVEGRKMVPYDEAEEAIELIEEDAREQLEELRRSAKEAFKSNCHFYNARPGDRWRCHRDGSHICKDSCDLLISFMTELNS